MTHYLRFNLWQEIQIFPVHFFLFPWNLTDHSLLWVNLPHNNNNNNNSILLCTISIPQLL